MASKSKQRLRKTRIRQRWKRRWELKKVAAAARRPR